jgi:nucleoid DNA-binding protein
MSKQNVVKKVSGAVADVTQDQVGSVFDAVFDVLGGLAQDQSCRIKDFGTFKVKLRAERTGTSLKDRKPIKIPPRLAMTFKLAGAFKESINAAPAKKAAKKAPAKKAPAKKAAKKKK